MSHKTFTQNFISSLKALTKSSINSQASSYIPREYPNDGPKYPGFITLLAGGQLTAAYPYFYDMEHLEAYCILYTESGSGYLRYENRTYYLDPYSLVFFDCRKAHHIEIQHSPWEYKILYLEGAPLQHYYELFSQSLDVIFFVRGNSYLPGLIDKIVEIDCQNEYYHLIANKKLNDFLTELTIEKKHGLLPLTEIKSHVIEMKYMFDSNCEFHYTLEWLEEHFKISRYRLCHEFKEAEGISPIAYLNSIRINTAKNLLLSTQLRVNEIATAVGIDNVNHFIKLFKANTGTTPSKYRK
jgi:AraC-like DNA-binding protein